MLRLISDKKLRDFGILDPDTLIFKVTIVFKESVPEVTMIPEDNGIFTRAFSRTILNGGFVPTEGMFIYEICLGEQSKIISDDTEMARRLLKRFGHLLMEPMELFTRMLCCFPHKEVFEARVKSAMQEGLLTAARSGQVFDFDWEISCCDSIKDKKGKTDESKVRMIISISGIKDNHPFFSIFLELIAEAITAVVKANKHQILSDFVGSITMSSHDLEKDFN